MTARVFKGGRSARVKDVAVFLPAEAESETCYIASFKDGRTEL